LLTRDEWWNRDRAGLVPRKETAVCQTKRSLAEARQQAKKRSGKRL
jgi:hypothetical protein